MPADTETLAPSPESPTSLEATIAELRSRTKKTFVLFVAVAALLTAALACLALLTWRKDKAIEQVLKNNAFGQFEENSIKNLDVVTPQVNTIQFLRHGYSITFNSVEYRQEGLALSGSIGNPTQLWISSLALKFTARPYPYQIRDEWDKDYTLGNIWSSLWSSSWDIGSGQTTVGWLNPGSTMPFSVTIPNVKQTKDNIQIIVEFTGERYSYYK